MNDTLTGPRRPSSMTAKSRVGDSEVGAPGAFRGEGVTGPSRKDARDADDSESPPTYLFELLAYDELAQEETGSIGLSPPTNYHLQSWKVGDEAVVVCWEHDDA